MVVKEYPLSVLDLYALEYDFQKVTCLQQIPVKSTKHLNKIQF